MAQLTMPKLSDSEADAVIVRWLKSPGESFDRGEGLIEVETDKATVVYEAETDGTLESILAPEGASVAVGEPIATVSNGDGSPGGTEQRVSAERQPTATPTSTPAAPSVVREGSGARQPEATPVARRTAVELGVSLYGVTGTGPGGRITREDVERAVADSGAAAQQPAESPAGGKGEVRVLELTSTQRTIARRMVESATTIPVFTVSADIDMSEVEALRGDARGRGESAPSLNDFVLKATAETLVEFPKFNASYVAGKIECYTRINVGIAVATDDALLVPVVFDADRKTLAQISADTRRLSEAGRERALTPGDLHGGTFTVSNLGMLGVRSFTALVDPPQAAILAVGSTRRAAVEEARDRLVFRDVMTVTLTGDHRVVYGADGARFLSRLRELLERPHDLARDETVSAGGR